MLPVGSNREVAEPSGCTRHGTAGSSAHRHLHQFSTTVRHTKPALAIRMPVQHADRAIQPWVRNTAISHLHKMDRAASALYKQLGGIRDRKSTRLNSSHT